MQVAVGVEVPRGRNASVRLVANDREDGDLRMRDSEETGAAEGLEVSQNATTETTENISPLECGYNNITATIHTQYKRCASRGRRTSA